MPNPAEDRRNRSLSPQDQQLDSHSEMANLHRNLDRLHHPHNLMHLSLARDTPVIKVSFKSVRSEFNPDHPQKLTGCSLA